MAQEEGLFTASDYALLAQSSLFTTAGMTRGFSGKKFGGFGALGNYMGGLPPDLQVMRKITQQTWPSRQYARLASRSPFLRSVAPTLGHLGPSKLLTYWSALAGNEKALQTLTAMGKADVVARAGMAEGKTIKDIFGSKDYGMAKGMQRGSMQTPFSRLTGGLTWEQLIGPDSSDFKFMRNQQMLAMERGLGREGMEKAGQSIAHFANLDKGLMGAGTSLINRGMASGGLTGSLFRGGGKMIPGATRFLGGVTAGIDLYTIGSFGFGMMGKGMVATLELPSKMYMGLTSGIHRGTFMSSAPLSPFVGATGRQRAMANIYDRQLNLRQVLGNEAALLSGY